MLITPITGHIHYDDVLQVWSVKASRSTKSLAGNVPFQELRVRVGTYTDALSALSLFWAAPPTGDDPAKINAPLGSFADFGAAFAAGSRTPTEALQLVTPGTPAYPGADPTLPVPVYPP